jgi:hypothetical protein
MQGELCLVAFNHLFLVSSRRFYSSQAGVLAMRRGCYLLEMDSFCRKAPDLRSHNNTDEVGDLAGRARRLEIILVTDLVSPFQKHA